MLFAAGEVILYGNQGIFRVGDIIQQDFSGTKLDYYELNGVYETQRKVFVPVKSEKLTSLMMPVLSASEVNSVIDSVDDENIWIDNEAARKEKYKSILSSGDRRMMLLLIATLYKHREACQSRGRKMHQSDERLFKEAEKLICSEFSYVLGIEQAEVGSYIAKKLESKAS